jgi:hypothetical protein
MRHVTKLRLVTLALALAPLAAACGGSSSSTDSTTAFLGTWTFDTGQATATCTGNIPSATIPLAGLSGMITKVDNMHIKFEANSACIIPFSVSGSTATAQSGQSCTLPVPMLGPTPIAITSWTLTLSGSTMSAAIVGTALGTSPPLCNATGSGTLTMHPPSDGGTDASTGG